MDLIFVDRFSISRISHYADEKFSVFVAFILHLFLRPWISTNLPRPSLHLLLSFGSLAHPVSLISALFHVNFRVDFIADLISHFVAYYSWQRKITILHIKRAKFH